MSASALYEGEIRHRRFGEVEHGFRHRILMSYLDLDELPELLDRLPLWSARRAAPVRYRRDDYLGDPERPLKQTALDLVAESTGARPDGPVRLLSHLRQFGYSFNPVSFLYCFDATGERVEAVIAAVTNTPWRERHPYVMVRGEARGAVLADRFEKQLHVSPFFGMDSEYELRASEPGERLSVHIESTSAGEKAFDATLSLARRDLDRRSALAAVARYPAMSAQVVARIYLHAVRLKLKGARWVPHPAR